MMNPSVIRAKLTVAFRALRKKGFVARQNFKCCSSCALFEIPDGKDYIFYHRQSGVHLEESSQVYLQWKGDPKVIREALEAVGLVVEHNGSPNHAFLVHL